MPRYLLSTHSPAGTTREAMTEEQMQNAWEPIQALEAGKHVFCEKPPAMHAAEVHEMIAARDKAGKHLMFNFNNRARPESYAMMEYISQGVVGTINSCQAKWIRRTGIPGFGGWFTTKAMAGGGATIDLLHMIDLQQLPTRSMIDRVQHRQQRKSLPL